MASSTRLTLGVVLLVVGIASYFTQRALAIMAESKRSLSPRDGGTPKGLIPPRSRVIAWHGRCAPGLHWHVKLHRLPREKFANTYVFKWLAVECVVAGFTHVIGFGLWREKWADPA